MLCLLPEYADKLREAIAKGEIDYNKLNTDSATRRDIFAKFMDAETAKQTNLLIEQKFLLKNKELAVTKAVMDMLGDKDWAKQKADVVAKLRQTLQDKKDKIFNPGEGAKFLNEVAADIYSKRYKTEVSLKEAENITKLAMKSNDLLDKNYNKETETWSSPKDRAEAGATKVALENYINSVKEPDMATIGKQFNAWKQELGQTFKDNKAKGIGKAISDTIKTISNNMISLVATLDNSFLGRQGINTLKTHPTVWWDMAKKSFSDFAKTVGGQETMDALMADVYTKPNYINGSYDIANLIPKTEEQYPVNLPEHLQNVPGKLGVPLRIIGRTFKASEVAFKGSAIRARVGLYDLLAETAKRNGNDMTDKVEIKELGKLINSVTARGGAKWTNSPVVKLILWAPKMLQGSLDVLTAHGLGAGLKTSFARKQAFINLAKISAEYVGAAVILNAISPNSYEINPLSSNFLKVNKGNTHADTSGGQGSIITMFARLLTGYTKNSLGKIVKINSGKYGAGTTFDVGINFLVNKTTPPVRTLIDYLRGTDANFQKTTWWREIFNKMPISIQNWYGINNDYSTQAIIGALIDLVGINSNTYAPLKKSPKKLK